MGRGDPRRHPAAPRRAPSRCQSTHSTPRGTGAGPRPRRGPSRQHAARTRRCRLVGGEGWRRTPDFILRWANPSEGDRAPIARRASQPLRRSHRSAPSAADCRRRDRQLRLTRTRPGEHTATVWREDAAGNHERDNESVPVTLRYDPEPPRPAFESSSVSDPTRVSVAVIDRVSGLAGAGSRSAAVGSGVWQTLATRKSREASWSRGSMTPATRPGSTYSVHEHSTRPATRRRRAAAPTVGR